MKDMHPDILELLVKRSTEGLSAEQNRRLHDLLEAHGQQDTDDLDLAAAAAANAFGIESAKGANDAPETLKTRLRDDADRYFERRSGNVIALEQKTRSASRGHWGWATAAALALVLFATNLVDRDTTPAFEAAREELLADSGDTLQVPWATPEDPEFGQVSGDVVWNDERQEGYMLLTGMPVNDPATSQYQLWVVDPDRDDNPVDGGVFDIPPGASTVVIPIDAKLAVDKPVAFAITREQPGGVVVSKGPLLVIASAG
ncbi:MAG: anti-sigma factor [Woeseiaceae bacterium]|nr:anti-sigma factor [Woeseiaceae bacterium]